MRKLVSNQPFPEVARGPTTTTLTLRVFAPPSNADFIPFLACHHTITDSEINAFLNQDSYRLLRFVSDLVSIFDTG
eukprot:scaffold151423_cov15-Tisochrysis_lutea.AAC.1